MDENIPQPNPDQGHPASESTAENVSPKTLAGGTVIEGRYEVLAHIGSGGMGEVYKVLDKQMQTVFALKMISPHLADQKTLAKRLEHEAKAARTLVHGNIVTVYDVGRTNDAPFLLMDFVEGDSLEDLINKEAVLTPARAIPIFIQIAEALVYAQQKGVVHRDLKPSNILMTKTPSGGELVKIVDFGIAKISDQDSANKTKLTQTGELLGTPLYMSPEQCTGDEADVRSDIYSFGCIMYEVLVGKSPFAAENQVKVILKHLSDELPPFPNNVGISTDLKNVITRCLARNQSERYQNAVELQIDLERVHDGRKISADKNKRRFTRKRKNMAAVAACVLVGLTGAVFGIRSLFNDKPVATTASGAHRPERWQGKSLAQWTAAIEKSPDDPHLYYNRAMLHQARDERTNEIDDLSEALKLKPDYLAAYKSRCITYTLTAQYDKAAADADKLIALNPDSASSYETRAWVYGARDQFYEAIGDWKRAIAISPSPYFYYQLASEQMKLAQYDAAQTSIRKAIDADENFSPALGIAGLLYAFQQKYPEAEEQFRRAVSNPDVRGVEWQLYAYYYACVGKDKEAQAAIDRAKALETFPARSFRLAGEYYRTSEQFEKAIQEFSASTSLEEYPPGYRERAMTYISINQWRSALTDLQKALKLNPFSSNTLSYLALVESKLGMKTEAAKHIKAAINSKELAAIIYVNQAGVELNIGDAAQALKYVNRAIGQDRWLKEGYEMRAAINRKLNDQAGADKDSSEAKKLISHLDY
jgi:serine/threonine protein kinase/predicted Zn-dependent protease